MSNLGHGLVLWLAVVITSLVGIYLTVANIVRRILLRKQTGVCDLALLGLERDSCEKIQGTAVICGGSIAGLAAARVCHDHFSQVIIIESEDWLTQEDGWVADVKMQKNSRSRVMQYFSLQGFQVFGFLCLRKLFPNLRRECLLSDVRILPGDFKTSTWGKWTMTPYADYKNCLPPTIFAGRPGLETLLRRMVIGRDTYPNIKQIPGTVIALEPKKKDRKKIGQVVFRSGNSIQTIDAALVIDSTGPACSSLKWLRRAGYGFSESYDYRTRVPLDQLKISYDPKMRYSTFQISLTSEIANRLPIPGGYSFNVGPIYNCITDADQDCRSVYSQRIEGDIIQICCGAWGNVEVPETLAEVVEYSKSLVVQTPIPAWFFDFLLVLSLSETITCSTVRVPPPFYIRYQKAFNIPSNWIAIGDSVMRVNPIFGQGCTKALLGSISINTILHTSRATTLSNDFAKRFFDIQAAKIGPIWIGTKTVDYGYTTTNPVPGEKLAKGSFLRWYSRRLHILAFKASRVSSLACQDVFGPLD